MRWWWIAALALSCAGTQKPAAPPKATLAISRVRVFDGEKVMPRATVLIDGDRIVAVGNDFDLPEGVAVVDGNGKTLLPGLIDAHAHAFFPEHLEQALVFGVTTVLDQFNPQYKELKAKDAPGQADVRSAGIVATAPGGHCTEYGFPIPTITRPEEAQAFVDARLAEGSDWIKLVLDDGHALGIKFATLDLPTVKAVIAAAHARGKLAVAHIMDYDSAHAVFEAGGDGLVHMFRDKAAPAGFGAFVASRKGFVIPTLAVQRSVYGERGTLGGETAMLALLPPDVRANLESSFKVKVVGPKDAVRATIKELTDAGVPILAGTDAPNPGTAHGASLHDEMALLVEAGLTPVAALTAATSAPARAFRLDDRGRIAPGLRADLVMVDGDPTVDIKQTRTIAAVWRGGKQLDTTAYRARLAEEEKKASAAPRGIADLATWEPSTDNLIGGTSTVNLGREGGALVIEGELMRGKMPVMWAGAMFMPGPVPFQPVDLSAKKGLSFRARGDGKTYVVMLFTKKGGRRPAVFELKPGPAMAPVEAPWSAFNSDGSDVTGVLIGAATEPGKFKLVVEQIELR